MERNIIVRDIVSIGDPKDKYLIIPHSEYNNVLYDGRQEDLMHTSTGEPHNLLKQKVCWIEALNSVIVLHLNCKEQ